MKGFFDSSEWAGQRQPLALLPECGKCKLDLSCKSPRIPISGKGAKKILIIAEAPDQIEDERNKQLVGDAGVKLTQMLHRLGINIRKDCWLHNAVICRPPRSREPTSKEIGFCRPNLTNTIESLNPNVIIPLGKAAVQSIMALAWKDGEVDSVAKWAGWKIPCQKLNTWICPTYHPSFLCRSNDVPAYEMLVMKHLKQAVELTEKPYPDGLPDYKKQIRIIENPDEVHKNLITMMAFGRPIAVDIETTTLKPDSQHARILCCAVSDGRTAFAFPWVGTAIEAMKEFLKGDVKKTVANLRFESRWFKKFLGFYPKNWWCDTLLSTHWHNCMHGICSVKFQSFVLFGIDDYDRLVDSYKKSKDNNSNTPNQMHKLDKTVLMEYCALDVLFEAMIASYQLGK